MNNLCSIEGCGRKKRTRGLCTKHYGRLLRHGTTDEPTLNQRHGLKKSEIYSVWINMRGRCNNPKLPEYKYYGGRGIRVCKRWDSFAKFVEDMGKRPEGYTIDRINNDGNYEPSNCRWASRATQTKNRRYMQQNNTSGHTGVTWYKKYNKWMAYIGHSDKLINLGYFVNINDAIKARKRAEEALFNGN